MIADCKRVAWRRRAGPVCLTSFSPRLQGVPVLAKRLKTSRPMIVINQKRFPAVATNRLEFKPFSQNVVGRNMIFCLVQKHLPDLLRNIDFPVNENPVYRKLRGQFKAAAVKNEKVR